MNLDTLIEGLEKAAMVKQAAQAPKETPLVSKELEAVLTKEASATNASRAFEDGEKIAKEILEKLAAEAISATPTEPQAPVEAKEEVTATATETAGQEKVAEATQEVQEVQATPEVKAGETTQEEDMNKQAQDAGKELATAILEKLAEGAVENAATGGPNRLQQTDAALVAQHDARIGPTPARNGTLAQMFDAIVDKAKAISGAVSYDQVAAGTAQAPSEGKDQAMGTPAIAPSPDVIDKTAAVNALVEAGLEWEDAVDLVKAAAYEIEQEEVGQVKLAAVGELMSQGVDFDSAVDAVIKATQAE